MPNLHQKLTHAILAQDEETVLFLLKYSVEKETFDLLDATGTMTKRTAEHHRVQADRWQRIALAFQEIQEGKDPAAVIEALEKDLG